MPAGFEAESVGIAQVAIIFGVLFGAAWLADKGSDRWEGATNGAKAGAIGAGGRRSLTGQAAWGLLQ